jgi:hypothetical protein
MKLLRIRMNSIDCDLYLSRSGKWVEYKHAAKFSSVTALEKFAAKHSVSVYGIF